MPPRPSSHLRAVLLVGACAVPAHATGVRAADLVPAVTPPSVASRAPLEIRLGAFLHDPAGPEEYSADVNGEILVALPVQPDPSWSALIPRVHAGATVNTAG